MSPVGRVAYLFSPMLSKVGIYIKPAPEARREVSPARKRWVKGVFKMRAPEARHLISHIFSECNAHRFQHKRAAEKPFQRR